MLFIPLLGILFGTIAVFFLRYPVFIVMGETISENLLIYFSLEIGSNNLRS